MYLTFQFILIIISNIEFQRSHFGKSRFLRAKLTHFIVKKIASFSHQEYNNDIYLEKNQLIEKIKNGINLLNNSSLVYIPIEENANLPYKYDVYLTPFYIK
jgi:hypothetical protein